MEVGIARDGGRLGGEVRATEPDTLLQGRTDKVYQDGYCSK